MSLALFGATAPSEVLLILIVILLLFGAKKLPELSRSLGKSLSEFKKGKEEGLREFNDSIDSQHKSPTETQNRPDATKPS